MPDHVKKLGPSYSIVLCIFYCSFNPVPKPHAKNLMGALLYLLDYLELSNKRRTSSIRSFFGQRLQSKDGVFPALSLFLKVFH